MAKRLALVIAVLFLPALAKADSFVSVVINPVQLSLSGEYLGASFVWDTTTQALSDFSVTSTGPLNFAFSNTPTVEWVQNQTIMELVFHSSLNNETVRLEYFDDFYHLYASIVFGSNPPPILSSTPGTYFTYVEAEGFLTGFDIANQVGSATVTSLGDGDHDGDDPVSAPEPGSLLMLGAGIASVALATCAMRQYSTTFRSFSRLRA
jgi:PEP-CTERM motif